jgi:hypothetical protein
MRRIYAVCCNGIVELIVARGKPHGRIVPAIAGGVEYGLVYFVAFRKERDGLAISPCMIEVDSYGI